MVTEDKPTGSRTVARRWAIALPAALIAAAALSACSVSIGSKTVNQASLQTVLAARILRSTGTVVKVRCPSDEKAKKGRRFDCTATAPDGTKSAVHVTLIDDNGHFNAVDKTIAQQVVDPVSVANLVAARILQRTHLHVKVSCPSGIAIAVGKKFDCVAHATDGSSTNVRITLTDRTGGFTAVLLQHGKK